MKLTERQQRVASSAITGASKGALIAGASSIATGLAMTHTPVLLFWTAVAVSAPVVLAAAAGGAVVVGAAAGYRRYKQDKAIEDITRNALEKSSRKPKH